MRFKALLTGLSVAALFVACDRGPVVGPINDPQLTLSAESVSMDIGASASVTATVLHTSEQAQFVSRDQSVATVNTNGLITGVGAGTTYVVATLSTSAQARDSLRVRVKTPPPEIQITGTAVPGMESYDQFITDLMRKHSIPGGAVAVMYKGKLIYARGFGYADVENKKLVQPDALFRIASISKSITSAAIMKLVEDGKLELSERVAPFIEDLTPAPGATVDPRWEQITIRQLLNHTAGWDRTKPAGDAMDRGAIAAATLKVPMPASMETIIRYMKGLPLDFDPGEKFVYSNFGFGILGRVIEKLSGMPYEEFVRTRVLLPVGANRTRSGKTRMSDAFADEVKYYYPGFGVNAPLVPSVFPGEGLVPFNYGAYYMESMYASGGWVSSTVDLLRFLGGIDGRGSRPDILRPELIAEMTSKINTFAACAGGACYYAGGWFVRPMAFDAVWYHGGTLPGADGMLVRTSDDFAMVALFNTRSLTAPLELETYDALFNALNAVATLPTHDLFSTFR